MMPSDQSPAGHAADDEEQALQRMLRETTAHLPDAGFSARVLGGLPAGPDRSGWRRRLLVAAAALAGAAIATWLDGPSLAPGLGAALAWSAQPLPGGGYLVTGGSVLCCLVMLASGLWANVRLRR